MLNSLVGFFSGVIGSLNKVSEYETTKSHSWTKIAPNPVKPDSINKWKLVTTTVITTKDSLTDLVNERYCTVWTWQLDN